MNYKETEMTKAQKLITENTQHLISLGAKEVEFENVVVRGRTYYTWKSKNAGFVYVMSDSVLWLNNLSKKMSSIVEPVFNFNPGTDIVKTHIPVEVNDTVEIVTANNSTIGAVFIDNKESEK